MPCSIAEFQKISKAIDSSYQLLSLDSEPSLMALQSLEAAEQSLEHAIHYFLSLKGCSKSSDKMFVDFPDSL